MEEAILEVLDKPLIVYGWQPDGLLATIIALSRSGTVDAMVQTVTTWKPRMEELEEIALTSRSHKSVLLLSTSWTGVEIDLLAQMLLAPLGVVDNNWTHLLPRRQNVIYYNPSPRGDPRGQWPSITAILSSLLGNPYPILAATGIVSGLWDASKAHRIYQNLMSMAGLDHVKDYPLVSECAWQAYGVTASGDPKVYMRVPQSIVEASIWDPCKALLSDAVITTLRAEAEESLEVALDAVEVRYDDNIIIAVTEGEGPHYYFISYSIALSQPDKIIITGYRDLKWRENYACIWHVKGRRPLARHLIDLRREGYEAKGLFQGSLNYLCVKRGDKHATLDDLMSLLNSIIKAGN